MSDANRQSSLRTPRRGGVLCCGPLKAAGMTLVEVMVVLIIVAGMVGGGVYMTRVLTHSNLKEEAMRLASTIQYANETAALNSRQYRLVIDLDNNEYRTEVTEADVIVDAEDDQMQEGFDEGMLPEEVREMEAEQQSGGQMYDDDSHDPFGITRRTGYQEVDDLLVDPRTLGDNLEIEAVLTEVNTQPVRRGRVAIHFFPNGRQQEAYILLRDTASEARFTLMTEPLTGRVLIRAGQEEIPEDFGEERTDGMF